MKNQNIVLRVSEDEKTQIKKAAMENKNISAFLLSAVRKAHRYRRIIEQAEKLERAGFKPGAMVVKI